MPESTTATRLRLVSLKQQILPVSIVHHNIRSESPEINVALSHRSPQESIRFLSVFGRQLVLFQLPLLRRMLLLELLRLLSVLLLHLLLFRVVVVFLGGLLVFFFLLLLELLVVLRLLGS